MLPLKDLTSTQSESAAIPSSPCAINTRVKNCWSSGRGSRWRISTIPAIPFVLRNTRARRRRFPRGRREEPLIAIHVAEVEGILGSSKSGLRQHIKELVGQTNVTVRFYHKIAAALWGKLLGLGRKASALSSWRCGHISSSVQRKGRWKCSPLSGNAGWRSLQWRWHYVEQFFHYKQYNLTHFCPMFATLFE